MANLTDLGFTLLELGKAVDDGDIRVQTHPEFPNITIANYTEAVQYSNRWSKITLACRGLIFDSTTGAVIARPWEKFFNLGQMDNRIESTAPVEVTDKLDGSLGILYRRPDRKFAIATRGSFASEQAIHATELLNTRYAHIFECESGIADPGFMGNYLNNFTFLFEIIYPDNRIVVNYNGMDDLVILGSVDKTHGFYSGPGPAAAALIWDGPKAEVFKYSTFVDAISAPDRAGKEGYVIRSGTKMVKIKQYDYVELHRIVTNLSPKTIWEMLYRGESIGSICGQIPDDFHDYVKGVAMPILSSGGEIKYGAILRFLEIKNRLTEFGKREPSRREYAEEFKKENNSALLFLMLDGRDINESVWKMVKPRGDIKTMVSEN